MKIEKNSFIKTIIFMFSLIFTIFLGQNVSAKEITKPVFPNHFNYHSINYRNRSYNDFVKSFWNPSQNYFYTNSNHQINPDHTSGPQKGLYSDYWWEAQSFDLVLDHYQKNPSLKNRQMIDLAYDGFLKAYPKTLDNDFNDDIGWWANYLARAYQLTHEKRFLNQSIKMFHFISGYEDTTYGGGIWWKNTATGVGADNEKNVATNGTASMTAVRLYKITGDKAYLNTAQRLFKFLKDNYYYNGRILDRIRNNQKIFQDWTYDYGQFANASFQLYRVTGQKNYRKLAQTTYDWSIKNITKNGILPAEGQNDQGGFKGIYVRDLAEFSRFTHLTKYNRFLDRNAYFVVKNMNAQGISGCNWNKKTTGMVQSQEAASGAILLQYAKPILFKAIN